MAISERKTFSPEIKKTFKEKGYFIHKIADAFPMKDQLGNIIRRNMQKKPFDMIADINGAFIGIELKLNKTNSFNLTGLREKESHQVDNLCERKYGWFIINFRFEYKGQKINDIVFIKATNMKSIINEGEIKFIKWDEIKEKSPGELFQRSKGIWEFPMSKLIGLQIK